jgi:hypothetical protein
MIDKEAFDFGGKLTVRDGTSEGDGCLRRVRSALSRYGGLAAVSSVTGLARSTIERGLKDLDAAPLARGRVRREGGGPRRKDERDATVLDDLFPRRFPGGGPSYREPGVQPKSAERLIWL